MKNTRLTKQFEQASDDRLNFSASLKAAGSDSYHGVGSSCSSLSLSFPSSCLLITVTF